MAQLERGQVLSSVRVSNLVQIPFRGAHLIRHDVSKFDASVRIARSHDVMS